ncbi:MAG TPA: CusA/CzcA family heavy metal efflux RND transporter [Gammaproteobacteria bacterium]|nr:CusA/CzcA family heavy metal efflux RND transporter [Gammaproteobacteria bacterium]
MIARLIRASLSNRGLVLLFACMLAGAGVYAIKHIPLDALPDLSDVQVIIHTSYPGQAPQVVEDQVTYPLSTAMLSVPGSVNVRGYSYFGDSYVYVIFKDGTDPYWARSRVLEYLSQAEAQLPAGVKPALGPDATGVGWVYQYALVDKTGKHDLAQLTSLQNWYLKYALQTVPGVAEVATMGGMVKQYQVVLDPQKLRAYGIPLARVKSAIDNGNREISGSVIEMGEAEYMVRATGYIQNIHDLQNIPLMVDDNGTPVLLKDVADIRLGPAPRRGVADLNGNGEVVGGIVIMRYGENALKVIEGVKAKLAQLSKSLPAGVEIVPTYDRSKLIHRAVHTLDQRLIEEIVIVLLVCALFLFHLRSALVVLVSLPLGVLAAFLIMYWQGVNANIMSLGGLALAIGAMVDPAVVMIENLHKHFERETPSADNRWRIVAQAAVEVGPSLFFSLVIIALSFLPIFALQAQEGRMFAPLAYTKTYAMAAAAGLAVTLVPVLMGYFVRGRIVPEHKNPINRMLIAAYRPAIRLVLRWPWAVIGIAVVIVVLAAIPATRLGSEFMPTLNEGTLLYMPTTYPAVSIGEARRILQQTDRLIKSVPEVKRVFGKVGRARTATDTAPITMFDTVVQLQPKSEWRPGMTIGKLKRQLNALVHFPGLSNAWVYPIQTRESMQSTGIKTPVGIKIAGPDLKTIERIGKQVQAAVRKVPGTVSVYADRTASGRYIVVHIKRDAAARFGLNIADVQRVVATAVGGMNVTTTVEGRERFPVNMRYPQSYRDSPDSLRLLPIVTPRGATIPLGQVADIRIENGPGMIKTENARPSGWVYIDIAGRDLGSYVADAQQAVAAHVKLPPGYTISWAGKYQYMQRAEQRLMLVVPVTLLIILLLLYLNFRRFAEVWMIMGTLPLALVGGFVLLWLLGYNLSVAVWVGFIALGGVSAELGVVMLLYLNQAWQARVKTARESGAHLALQDLRDAVMEGTALRIRPIAMTVAAIIVGLLPIMVGGGTGAAIMSRIAAPMVGGMVTATLLSLLVLPAVYYLWQRRRL